MREPARYRLVCWMAAIVLGLLAHPAAAQQPAWSYNDDPVARAYFQAIRDRRDADAEKILSAAILAAEKTAPNPQLSFYLRGMASLLGRKGDAPGAVAQAQRALENTVRLYGSADIRAVGDMSNVAGYLRFINRFQEAEQLLKQAVDIALRAPDVADVEEETRAFPLASLASLYNTQGRTGEAVQLLEEAVKDCPTDRVSPMCNMWKRALSDLYRKQGRLTDAERLPGGPEPPDLGRIDRQAQEAMRNRLYVQAEILYRNAIAWIGQNPKARAEGSLAMQWVGLGRSLEAQGRNLPAEDAYKQALAVSEARVNPKIGQSAYGLIVSPLANLYASQGRFTEAEAAFQRVVGIQEKILGSDHAQVAETLLQFARVYRVEGKSNPAKYSDAVGLYDRALRIHEKNFGLDSRQLSNVLIPYISLLRDIRQSAKAAELQSRLDAIRKPQ